MKREISNTRRVLTSEEINLVSGGLATHPIRQFEDMWGDTMSHEEYMDWIIGQMPGEAKGDNTLDEMVKDAVTDERDNPHDFPNRT